MTILLPISIVFLSYFFWCNLGRIYLDFDKYTKFWSWDIQLLSFGPLQSLVIALDDSVGGYFLNKAAFLVCIEVEVQSVGCRGQDEERQ